MRLHFPIGGKGAPLVLLPGWPQTRWAFHKMLPELTEHSTVIDVDLRGMEHYPHLQEPTKTVEEVRAEFAKAAPRRPRVLARGALNGRRRQDASSASL